MDWAVKKPLLKDLLERHVFTKNKIMDEKEDYLECSGFTDRFAKNENINESYHNQEIGVVFQKLLKDHFSEECETGSILFKKLRKEFIDEMKTNSLLFSSLSQFPEALSEIKML